MSKFVGATGRGAMKEHNTQPQGRSGSKVPIKTGPVGSPKKNPTKGGGINRATQGGSSLG